MEKITVPPDQNGYSVTDVPGVLLHQALDGGLARQRRDLLDANRIVTVRWTVGKVHYQYLIDFYKAYIGRNCQPFQIDLYSAQSVLTTYSAYFINFNPLDSFDGFTFTISASLELVTNDAAETHTWPGGAIFTFTPASLFAGDITSGGFYDFTDQNTLWANTTRTVKANVGDNVLRVTDKSGNGRHLQGNGTNTGAGVNLVSNQYYVVGGGTLADGVTSTSGLVGKLTGWFMMAAFVKTHEGGASVIGADADSERVAQAIKTDGFVARTLTFNQSGSNNALLSGGSISSGQKHFISVYRSPTVEILKLDGSEVNRAVRSENPAQINSGFVAFGADYGGISSPVAFFNDKLLAGLFLNRLPTQDEQDDLDQWFTNLINATP